MSSYVETVTKSIIRQLENGTAPWIKPWKPGERYLPYNPTTQKEYRGMNSVWLLSLAENNGYGDARWMTYKQATSLDAQVNKGEKGSVIQFWQWTEDIPKLDESGKPVRDESGLIVKQTIRLQFPKVRSAVVFNAVQITGLPEIERPPLPEWERHLEAEAILKDSGANIEHLPGNRAFYRPSSDRITLPQREQFPTADNYYATALHELGHWTGHESRLNRDLKHPFGSEAYAKEELRAEIASLMLGEKLSIGHDPGQHVAYIGSWIKALEEDPREIFRASADAEKITQYLLGREMLQAHSQVIQVNAPIQIPVLSMQEDSVLKTTPERVYLEVPYAEKEAAKKLGAKWDRQEKSWYAPAGMISESMTQWLPSAQTVFKSSISLDPQAEFAAALQEAGLHLKGLPIMDGKLHRVPVDGDKHGQKNGGYVGFMDGHPAGYINNYKTGLETTWKSEQPVNRLSESDRLRLEQEAAQRQLKRAEEREQLQAQTADLVADCWLNAAPAQNHPYLDRKGVQSYGLRINTYGSVKIGQSQPDEPAQQWSGHGELLVPIVDINGRFWGAQSIDDQGRKSFPRGGRIQGGHHILGNIEEGQPILIAEGYATAATVHEALGLPVVMAFNSGNLPAVAQAFREKHPASTLVIAGDNDHTKPIEKNVGLQKAQEAAQKVNGHLLIPKFDNGSTGTDWNDLAQEKGKDAAKHLLKVGIAFIKAQSKPFTSQQTQSHQKVQSHLLTKTTQALTR